MSARGGHHEVHLRKPMPDNSFDVSFVEHSENTGLWTNRGHGRGRQDQRIWDDDHVRRQILHSPIDSISPSSPALLHAPFQPLPVTVPIHPPGFRPSSTRPPSTRPTRRLRPLAEPFLPSPATQHSTVQTPTSTLPTTVTPTSIPNPASASTYLSKTPIKSSKSPVSVANISAAKKKNVATPKLPSGNSLQSGASDLDKKNQRAQNEIIDTLQTMNRTLEDYIRSTRASREARKSFAMRSSSSILSSNVPAVSNGRESPFRSHEALRNSSLSKLPSGFSPYGYDPGAGFTSKNAGIPTSLSVSGEYSRIVHEQFSYSNLLVERVDHEQEDVHQQQRQQQQQRQHALITTAPKISTTFLGFQVSDEFVFILRSAIDAISRLGELYDAQCHNGNGGCCLWMLDAVRAIAKAAAERLGLSV